MPMPMAADTNQYKASPLGKERVKNANMKGIIHNIVLFVEAVLGSAAGIIVIFC